MLVTSSRKLEAREKLVFYSIYLVIMVNVLIFNAHILQPL